VDAEFVASYNNFKAKYVFSNLVTIFEHYHYDVELCDITISLDELRKVELSHHETQHKIKKYDADLADINDLNYKYMYDIHLNAIKVLQWSGFNKPNDNRTISINDLLTSYKNHYNDIIKLKSLKMFDIRDINIQSVSSDGYLRSVITFFNAILRNVYGCCIKKKRSSTEYMIHNDSPFIIMKTLPNTTARKNIIYIKDDLC
jgi:hypothetical protein